MNNGAVARRPLARQQDAYPVVRPQNNNSCSFTKGIKGFFNQALHVGVVSVMPKIVHKGVEIMASLIDRVNRTRLPSFDNMLNSLESSFRIKQDFWGNFFVQYAPSFRYHTCSLLSTNLQSDIQCLAQEGQSLFASIARSANGIADDILDVGTQVAGDVRSGRVAIAPFATKGIMAVAQKAFVPLAGLAVVDMALEKMMGDSFCATLGRSMLTGYALTFICAGTQVATAPALAIYAGTRLIGTISINLACSRC
jgi:hypothetical protein